MRRIWAPVRDQRAREQGFGLIEILVVVAIIVVLIAIAIPTFLGARARAKDRSARSSLRVGLTAARGIYTDNGSYVGASTAGLAKAEPSLKFLATASTGPKVVRVLSATSTDTLMSVQSMSPKCFFVTDSSRFGPAFAVEKGTCAAAVAPGVLTVKPAAGSVAVESVAGTRPTWAASW
jgi:type IV pilus assembly protein PilA